MREIKFLAVAVFSIFAGTEVYGGKNRVQVQEEESSSIKRSEVLPQQRNSQALNNSTFQKENSSPFPYGHPNIVFRRVKSRDYSIPPYPSISSEDCSLLILQKNVVFSVKELELSFVLNNNIYMSGMVLPYPDDKIFNLCKEALKQFSLSPGKPDDPCQLSKFVDLKINQGWAALHLEKPRKALKAFQSALDVKYFSSSPLLSGNYRKIIEETKEKIVSNLNQEEDLRFSSSKKRKFPFSTLIPKKFQNPVPPKKGCFSAKVRVLSELNKS